MIKLKLEPKLGGLFWSNLCPRKDNINAKWASELNFLPRTCDFTTTFTNADYFIILLQGSGLKKKHTYTKPQDLVTGNQD